MLTEFALTPGVFEEEAHDNHDDWLDQLVELGRGMFPQVAVCASIVTNLGDGGWQAEAATSIARQSSQRARGMSQALMKKINRVLVDRQLCSNWPEDDLGWAREAVACDAIETIERIVAPAAVQQAVSQELPVVRSLSEVRDGGFWRHVQATASPSMVVSDQVALLRKICLHSEWVALVNPYCCTTEQRHCLDLIVSNLQAVSRIGPKHFELHTQAKDGEEEARRQRNLVAHIERSVTPHLTSAHAIEVYFWPQLRERVFIGGRFVAESGGTLRKSPRWGVSMNHVAHEADRPEDKTHWSLLSPEDIGFWFDRHIAEQASGKPSVHRISN